jgi:hypothetical protein
VGRLEKMEQTTMSAFQLQMLKGDADVCVRYRDMGKQPVSYTSMCSARLSASSTSTDCALDLLRRYQWLWSYGSVLTMVPLGTYRWLGATEKVDWPILVNLRLDP